MYFSSFYIIFTFCISTIFGKLNGNICGRAFGELTPEDKIVGGHDVGYYKYPWYAALMVDKIVACGGSLVGSKTVVSAAHCFKEYITGQNAQTVKLENVYNVTLGIYNRCQNEKTQKKFFVHKVYIHEKYKDNIPYYDISLLILEGNTNAYQPICLPKGPIKHPREGSVPGLGTLRYEGSVPCTLHEAELLIYPDKDCRNMINRTGNDPKKLYKAFCAGYLQGGIDTCQGDSGGPFQVLDGSQNHMLLGVVSFGFHCANPNLLGIYTDVSQYVSWIEEKAGFHATMEQSNSTNTNQGSEPEPEPEPTEKPPEATKKPHASHKPYFPPFIQTVLRPINILIFKNHQTEQIRLSPKKHQIRRKN